MSSPLHQAAYNGEKAKLQSMFASGEHEVDAPDEQGRTPLVHKSQEGIKFIWSVLYVMYLHVLGQMYASLADQADTVDMLIKLGATITAQDLNGQTPMHLAAASVSYIVHVLKLFWYSQTTPLLFRVVIKASSYCLPRQPISEYKMLMAAPPFTSQLHKAT